MVVTGSWPAEDQSPAGPLDTLNQAEFMLVVHAEFKILFDSAI